MLKGLGLAAVLVLLVPAPAPAQARSHRDTRAPWKTVSEMPLWPPAIGRDYELVLHRSADRFGVDYFGMGTALFRTDMSGQRSEDLRANEYRLVVRLKDGTLRALPDRATNERGQLRKVVAVMVQRRPKR